MNNFSVLHSFPVWLPQTQTWMYNQVHQLQQMGVDAHVVCERTQNLDQFQVANIHCLADEPMWTQLWNRGLRFAGARRHLNFLVSVGRNVGAQIVHSHFGNIGWTNIGAAKRLGAKHVVTFYGQDVNKLPLQFPEWRSRYLQLFAETDLVLCEGPHMAECIVALGCPAEKVKVQHLGVALDGIRFRPREWRPGETLRVLIAASFREKKGIPDAVEALSMLYKGIPFELTIIGDAGADASDQLEKQRILDMLNNYGLMGRTRLLGYQPHSVLLAEAYQHHIFLSPSLTASDGDTEGGAPVSLIEMVASGLPVVSTAHCDIPEVIQHGATGLLAAERDVHTLCRHLTWFAENHDRWEAMARAGRLHVEQEFSLSAQCEKLASMYENLLSS